MAYLDLRGAQQDLDIVASVGINVPCNMLDSAGDPYDLTGYSMTCVVKDDREQFRDYGGEHGSETTYSQSITNAANGTFTFAVPPSEFANKEGGTMTYELFMTDGNGARTGVLWGYIRIVERG